MSNALTGGERSAGFVAVDDAHIDVRGTTVLDDGAHERVEFQLAIDDDTSPIGRRLKESGRLVKGSTANGDCVLFRYLEGFRAEQIKDRADRVRRADLVPPRPASALTSGEGTAIDDE